MLVQNTGPLFQEDLRWFPDLLMERPVGSAFLLRARFQRRSMMASLTNGQTTITKAMIADTISTLLPDIIVL